MNDPQDPSDGFGAEVCEVYANFLSLTGRDRGNPSDNPPVEIPSTPALTAEAVESLGAQNGPTSAVSMTTGGITINLLFDAAAMAAPASFRAGIQQAASLLTAAISDQITVNIKIDYSGTGGGAAAGPDNGLYESYASVRANLINSATPGDTTFGSLPGGSSIQGQSNVAVWNAQLKLWGVLGANDTTTDDGSATFATDISSGLLVGVALHELTHAMGRVPYGPPYGSQPDIFDLFRFTSVGTRLINGASTAPAAYFSVDGGTTKLADYGRTSDPADFLNSGVQGASDPFNEFYFGGTIQGLSAVDKQQLDAMGFHLRSTQAQPDLTASFDHVSSTTILPGGSTSIDFWLVNFGNGSAAASTTGLYLSTDATITTADTLLTTVVSAALTPNGAAGYYDHQTVSLALPGNLAPGTYYIGGIADYANTIAESNEANNTYNVTQITVTGGVQAQPDLTASFDHVSSTTIVPGGSTSIDFWLVNFGSGSAAASTTGLYLSTDATLTTADTLLTTVSSAALTPNGTVGYYDHETVSLAMPGNLAPGTYYIGGIADYAHTIAESNEANNTYNVTQITVTGAGVQAQPDLTASFDHVSSTTIAPGGSTSVDFWLVNFGSGSAAASTTGLYLSTDATLTTADTLLTTVSSAALTSNGTAGYYDHETVSLALPGNLAPGTYYIGGIADYTHAIAESNEANNTYNVTQITVTGGAQPDLTASFDHVSSTTIAPGGSTSVDFWLVNFGSGSAAASTTGLYLSTDATLTAADTLLATVSSATLTSNGTAGYYDHETVSLALPGNLAPGTYYIGGIADYTNAIAESNEANNTHNVTQITVGAMISGATSPPISVKQMLTGAADSDTFTFKTALESSAPGPDRDWFDHAVAVSAPDKGHGIAADALGALPPNTVTAEMLHHHPNEFFIV